MGPTIVYVHGNGNKVRKDLLKRQWDEALFGRDMGASSRMAYWAPLRYEHPLPDSAFDEAEEAPASSLEADPSRAVQAPEEFIADVVLEAQHECADAAALSRGTAAAAEGDAEALEAWLRDMTYTAEALAEGEGAAPFEALVLPRPLGVAAFRALVRLTFKDVYAYFFGGFGQPMREVVRSAVSGIDGPVIVLGHSLGTIIAYDVLRGQNSSSLDVPLFVTVGSPLGVAVVQDLVVRPLQVPAPVLAWRNVSDARDLVALDHTLRPEYAPVDRCTDFLVRNDSSNHHGIREYLRTAPAQQPILELFQQ